MNVMHAVVHCAKSKSSTQKEYELIQISCWCYIEKQRSDCSIFEKLHELLTFIAKWKLKLQTMKLYSCAERVISV